jgi:uncharacterized DUF497 family protein
MFHIREVIVTPAQEEHIWGKHRVTKEEAEEVCFSEPLVIRGRDGSYAVYGQTDAGRYLIVYLYPKGQGVYSLATVREMETRERQRYQSHRKG